MTILNNLFGVCSKPESESENRFFDLQSLVNKLLLFDNFILYSPNLSEIPHIVKAFGFEGALELLSSGAFRISCELRIIGQIGQADFLVPGGKALPLCSYSVSFGYAHERRKWISDQLKQIRTPELNNQQFKKLKLAVLRALEENYLQDSNSELLQQTNNDLASNRGVKLAAAIAIEKEKGIKAKPHDFSIQLHQIGEQHFKAESNLGEVFSLDELEVHKIIEKALLGIAGLNQRIAEMKLHNALSGFLESETPLFQDRLEFLIQACNPNRTEENFDRVFRLKKFPDIAPNPNSKIDVQKLIEVRDSKELKEFREWLQKIDKVTDAEIVEQLNSIRSKLGVMAQGDVGKTTRLLLSTLAGSIPGVGTLVGLGLGTADTFLLEKVLPYSGVVAFVDKLYPSIFQHQ